MKAKGGASKCITPEDAARLEKILMEHIHIIRYTIVKVFGDTYNYLVDDCVSEVLLLACEKSDILLNHCNPGGWFVNTSKYLAYNMIRKHQHELKTVPFNDLILVSSSDDVLEEVVYQEWVEKQVPELLLSRLTNRELEIYTMLFIQKMTPKEVADKLHITVSTVRNIKKSIVDKIKNDIYTHNF